MSDQMREYHDTEWGVPVHDDQKLFEYLVLDAFQAGLSWQIILRKREGFRDAFHGFDPNAVATMSDTEVTGLMERPEIVRNRAKIAATVANASVFLSIQQEFGTFSDYMWGFVEGKPIVNAWDAWPNIPAQTSESQALSKDLKRRGFRFAGPTIVYAVMQSAGLVNDHTLECFRYGELRDIGK